MISDEDDNLEENVKVMENQIKAKKAILEEVLRTLENEKDKMNSLKRRKYIKDILNCEVSHESAENNIFSIERIDLCRFESNIIIRFEITNRSDERNLSVRASTSSKDSSIRWILFENRTSVNTLSVFKKSSILCVSIPFSSFLQNEKISLNICGTLIQNTNQLLNSSIYSIIENNQTPSFSSEASINESISFSEAIEDLDLKSIEFVDERKSVRIIQSIFTVYCCLEIQKNLDFSSFRRIFPGFLENDFDTWRLYVGTERFEGILIYTHSDGETTKHFIIGMTISICQKFRKIMDDQFFGI